MIESNTGTNFATHLAILHLETPNFIRLLIGHIKTVGKISSTTDLSHY